MSAVNFDEIRCLLSKGEKVVLVSAEGLGEEDCLPLVDLDANLCFYCDDGSVSSKVCGIFKNKYNKQSCFLSGGCNQKKQCFSIERQVRLVMGVLLLISLYAGEYYSSQYYVFAKIIAGANIFFFLTGWCTVEKILMKLPFNKNCNQ